MSDHDDDRSLVECAIGIASEAHAREWRKGKNGLPYMVHIYDIMRFARKIGIPTSDTDVYQAIALHDTVESGLPIGIIKTLLPQIVPVVEELTFLGTPEEKPDYLASFAGKSVVALVVKVMDRICNVWDFYDDGDREYARKYLQKASELWMAAYARRSEIIDRFGQAVWDNLSWEYDHVSNMTDEY
ncbi:MAG: hypothetical protein P4L67_04595 [Candidatus Pacebacteria bacterium]|nr:hypothetical protein [Candidatus Paceibacterota bacterium]